MRAAQSEVIEAADGRHEYRWRLFGAADVLPRSSSLPA